MKFSKKERIIHIQKEYIKDMTTTLNMSVSDFMNDNVLFDKLDSSAFELVVDKSSTGNTFTIYFPASSIDADNDGHLFKLSVVKVLMSAILYLYVENKLKGESTSFVKPNVGLMNRGRGVYRYHGPFSITVGDANARDEDSINSAYAIALDHIQKLLH